MPFRLPLTGTTAHEAMGDMAYVAEALNTANAHLLLSTVEAVKAAEQTLASCPAAKRINVIVLRPNDERWLISIGRRGGWRKIWNFGTGWPVQTYPTKNPA